VNVGPDQVVPAAQERGAGVVFDLLGSVGGAPLANLALCLLLTSIFAALLSFHNGVARYLFALGRERVLPAALGRTGVGSGAPIAGSVIQSFVALAAVATFAALGRDPVTELFSWLTYAGAAGVLLLMTGTSCAVIGFFAGRDAVESRWQRVLAPGLGAVALATITVVTIIYAGDVLGPTAATNPSLRWILPGVVLLAAGAGLLWARHLRTNRPDIYQGIGRGAVEPVGAQATPAPSPVPI
jgi:amino acid transporter